MQFCNLSNYCYSFYLTIPVLQALVDTYLVSTSWFKFKSTLSIFVYHFMFSNIRFIIIQWHMLDNPIHGGVLPWGAILSTLLVTSKCRSFNYKLLSQIPCTVATRLQGMSEIQMLIFEYRASNDPCSECHLNIGHFF